MIDHLTETSKKVIERAQEEARKLGHPVVGSEQILLGLMQDDGVAGKVFSAMQVGLTSARREVENIIGRGAAATVGQEIPLTPRAQRVLERAWDEAKAMGHEKVGTEHILLGVLLEEGSSAICALKALGIDTGTMHRKVFELMRLEKSKLSQQPSEKMVMLQTALGDVDSILDKVRALGGSLLGAKEDIERCETELEASQLADSKQSADANQPADPNQAVDPSKAADPNQAVDSKLSSAATNLGEELKQLEQLVIDRTSELRKDISELLEQLAKLQSQK